MFKTLYSFSCPECELLEIKRLDMDKEAPKSLVYFWLYWDRASNEIRRLDFVKMDSGPEQEMREFDQGKLAFDETGGELVYQGKLLKLSRAQGPSQDCLKAVSKFLEER